MFRFRLFRLLNLFFFRFLGCLNRSCCNGLRFSRLFFLFLRFFLFGSRFFLRFQRFRVDIADRFGTGDVRHGLNMFRFGFFLLNGFGSSGCFSRSIRGGSLLKVCRSVLRSLFHFLGLGSGSGFFFLAAFLFDRLKIFRIHLTHLFDSRKIGSTNDNLLFLRCFSRGLRFLFFVFGRLDLARFLLHQFILGQLFLKAFIHFRRHFCGRRLDFKPVFGQDVNDSILRNVKFYGCFGYSQRCYFFFRHYG